MYRLGLRGSSIENLSKVSRIRNEFGIGSGVEVHRFADLCRVVQHVECAENKMSRVVMQRHVMQ